MNLKVNTTYACLKVIASHCRYDTLGTRGACHCQPTDCVAGVNAHVFQTLLCGEQLLVFTVFVDVFSDFVIIVCYCRTWIQIYKTHYTVGEN